MFALHRLCPIPRARSRYVTLVQTVPPIIDTIATGRRFVFRLPKILLCSLFVISTGRGTNVSFARSRGQASIDNVDNEAASIIAARDEDEPFGREKWKKERGYGEESARSDSGYRRRRAETKGDTNALGISDHVSERKRNSFEATRSTSFHVSSITRRQIYFTVKANRRPSSSVLRASSSKRYIYIDKYLIKHVYAIK